MTKLVSLTIDGIRVEVPEGTLIVNAAKQAGINIPVFCYHPKLEPVGMCRMCLVEVGRPVIDRATNQPILEEDGAPKIQFSPKLETACTTPVSEGMVVRGLTDKAKAGRKDILEFLLTSHPLDCPICDKGGECSLQDLTMGFGPGQSRYLYDEKKHLAKQVPLGELIVLDRERCIYCARCVRFQAEIVNEPVIGFSQRGRSMEIISFSQPGFDSHWSGNTTDICPVGALTTVDFRFRARPWELLSAASICNHCPVGCNLTFDVRREAVSGGERVIKRALPRQNEKVNEIWICDKGRFGYHFAARSDRRLVQPLVRRDGELQTTSWDDAVDIVAERLRRAPRELFTLAGGRLSNEDLYNLSRLTDQLGGKSALYSDISGGELTTQIGCAPGTNFGEMSAGNTILVVASDLEEEAPLWWLRVKQAAERGAQLVVMNARPSRLERWAKHVIRYPFGQAASAILAMINAISAKRPDLPEGVRELSQKSDLRTAAKAFSESPEALIIFGNDCLGKVEVEALAQACANLLLATGHVGRVNNGLLGVWPRANDQGALELGFRSRLDLREAMAAAQTLYIAAADPVGDDPAYQAVFGGDKFVVVQDLFLTHTARLADVVLPAQSWTEREGSYTSGERRVQRFYPATEPISVAPPRQESPGTSRSPVLTALRPSLLGPQADYHITALISQRLNYGKSLPSGSAAEVFSQLAAGIPAFEGLNYQKLAEVEEQWPIIGRNDLYYGGTSYENSQGLGKTLPLPGDLPSLSWPSLPDTPLPKMGMLAFPVTRLYDQGTTLVPTQLLKERIGEPYAVLNPLDAARLKLHDGDVLRVTIAGEVGGTVLTARLDESLPERVLLVPRSFGIALNEPTAVDVRRDS